MLLAERLEHSFAHKAISAHRPISPLLDSTVRYVAASGLWRNNGPKISIDTPIAVQALCRLQVLRCALQCWKRAPSYVPGLRGGLLTGLSRKAVDLIPGMSS